MTRKTGVAFLALLLASTGSPGVVAAAGGSVTRTTASSSPTTAHMIIGVSSSAAREHAPASTMASAKPPCHGLSTLPTRSNLVLVDDATTCLIDRERGRHGLRTLQPNLDLQKVAIEQASEMVIGDYFGDDSMSGLTPIQRIEVSHYAWRVRRLSAGQNIGWGTGELSTPQAMVEGWMNSPPHRRIILDADYRNIGAGVAPFAPPTFGNGMPGAAYAVEFGARR
jgi:uncharacterized protein YkwD